MIDPYAASLEPITNAHQNVARTRHIIVLDPFHRRAALTACNGGVSSSDPGVGGECLSSPGGSEGGLAGLGPAGTVCAVAIFSHVLSICKEEKGVFSNMLVVTWWILLLA
jgi:hypothetical protein